LNLFRVVAGDENAAGAIALIKITRFADFLGRSVDYLPLVGRSPMSWKGLA
jgi:hypothetical protein